MTRNLQSRDDVAVTPVEAQSDIIAFAQRMYPKYDPQPHHIMIAEHLQAVARGDLDRLVITMPPRMGKSELASVNFPAWYLGNYPDNRIIGASYGDTLARRFSRRARNMLFDARWPWPELKPARDSAAVNEWDIEGRRGGMTAAGVGGPITGKGADLLLIDDPVKSAADADSATARENVWE
ncbi:MAG: terminase family protein, partial [Chloroflexota bacterium]|nr:terminase family protein [Chloroflexota bacterium]